MAVTFNNQTVTGTGTLLQTTFCSGGTISNGKEFIIFYGVNRKRNYSVVSCTSETNITIFPAIDTIDQTSTSAQYSVMAYNFIWYGGGDNINYYDNVAAFYATYYRTGLTRFLIEARRLGNLWLQNPAIDRGTRYSGPMAPATRVRAWIGLMYYLWETGQTSEWTYMYEGLDGSSLANAGLGPSADVREQSFYLGELATAILLGPDGSKSLTYIAMLEGSVYNSWNAAFNPSGYWSNKYYSNSFGGNYVINGTVTVTNGSPNIVGSGTTFTSAMCPSIPSSSMVVVLVSNDPNLNLTDTAAYACTFVDSTHITLDRPYTGSITGSGKYLAINRLVGTGIQPFILGLALGHMSIITEVVSANSANNWNNLINTSTNWLRDNARQIDTGGCYFGRISPGCEPPGLSYFGTCQYNPLITNPEGIWDSRFITGEVLTGMGKSLINTNISTVRAEIGILLGKALGKDGGPNSDSYFAQQLFEDSFVANPSRKSLGFWFGKGNSFVSTVGYKGGPNPILGNVNYINVNLTDVPNSTSIKIYQYTPNGVVFSTQTCVSNVCSFSVNTNVINSSIIAVEYLNGSNVLRKTQIF